MRYPQLIIHEPAHWLARLLSELADENRWLVHQPRTRDKALAHISDNRPGVLLVHYDPSDTNFDSLALIADAHRLRPDISTVAVCAAKLPDADKVAWSAAVLDLGARYALFPPLTRPVLEDVVSGFMAISIQRVLGDPTIHHHTGRDEEFINLADEGHAE